VKVVMASTQRGQRVKVMRAVFGGLSLLCLAGWLFTRTAGAAAATEATDAATVRAQGYASTVAREARLEGDRLVILPRSFDDAIRNAVSGDPTVARVRAWDPAGSLVVSTDPQDRPGRGAGADLRAALRGGSDATVAQATFTPLSGDGTATDTLIQTFVPLSLRAGDRPAGVVEVDFVRARIVSSWWEWLSISLAAAAAIFAALFVVAMTRETAPATVPLKKVEPPVTVAPEIRHDFRAATRGGDHGWVVPSSDSPPPPTSVAELEAATARIAELEKALERAADENEQVRSQAASKDQDIERLRQETTERVAALEEQMKAEDPEVEALRAKLAQAESRAAEAESLLSTAHEQLAAAHTQVGDTRVVETDDGDAARDDVPTEPAVELEPAAEPEPTDPTDLIAVLEARVAEAEARALHAKEEAMQLSPEASDLRMRLARTAARKKMGSVG